jgi:hypothetical protein
MKSGKRSGPIASTPAELGAGMRRLRPASLADLVQAQVQWKAAAGCERGAMPVLSKSTLSRYENGTIPPLKHAEHLDKVYQSNGWVALSIRSLWRSTWDPWDDEANGWGSQIHYGNWPAALKGQVWIKIRPQPAEADRKVKLRLKWGPWRRRVPLVLGLGGAVLTTGKAVDKSGVSVSLRLKASRPVFTLFGAGEDLDGDIVLNIEDGWTEAERKRQRE